MKLYAILSKRPTDIGLPKPVAVMATDDPKTILKSPPPSDTFPQYVPLWKKSGAPVQVVAEWRNGAWLELKAMPVEYLKPPKVKDRKKRKAPGSDTQRLAQHFVTGYIGRGWTNADYRGMHMGHARKILDLGYTYDQVVACLEALAQGDLTGGVPWVQYTTEGKFRQTGWVTLLCVLWGEPPAIERFLQGKVDKPGAFMGEDFKRWHRERDEIVPIQGEPEQITAARDFSKPPVWAGRMSDNRAKGTTYEP